jgi:flagellar motility protein MotE (MotC chaperone)
MTGYFRDLRLLPIAVAASTCLLLLVAADLFLDRTLSLGGDSAPVTEAKVVHIAPGPRRDPKESWAQQMFNFPDAKGAKGERTDLALLPRLPQITADKTDRNNDIITGSVPEPAKKDTKSEAKTDGKADAKVDAKSESKNDGKTKSDKPASGAAKDDLAIAAPTETKIVPGAGPGPSTAERAILERLQERREELDKRSRELDIREGLISEAEKRIDARLAEIKDAKAQLNVAEHQKDEAEAARFKGLVTMYENMKPRDAAKIFDRLETSVLIEVASQINPRNMSEILALMSPDAAQRLTVELAGRAKSVTKDPNANLPKIEGRPVGQ